MSGGQMHLGGYIAEALGLDPNMVLSLVVRCDDPREIPTVELVMNVPDNEGRPALNEARDDFMTVFRRFQLTPIETAS